MASNSSGVISIPACSSPRTNSASMAVLMGNLLLSLPAGESLRIPGRHAPALWRDLLSSILYPRSLSPVRAHSEKHLPLQKAVQPVILGDLFPRQVVAVARGARGELGVGVAA